MLVWRADRQSRRSAGQELITPPILTLIVRCTIEFSRALQIDAALPFLI
jgi:hypothetical protein